MEFTHGNAEKLKFYFLKIGKSNYERAVLLAIVTKTVGSDMPAVYPGQKENATNQAGNVINKWGHVFELHVEQEWVHNNPQFRDVAEYVRERRRCQRLPEIGGP
jgi:hypothetical protein